MTDICKNLFINIWNFEMKHHYFYYYSIIIWTSILMVNLLQCFKCVLQKILSQSEKSRLCIEKVFNGKERNSQIFAYISHEN